MTYFDWLVSFTQFANGGSARDIDILQKLFNTPYRYFIARDVNRACEGSLLRDEYSAKYAQPAAVATNECSLLEMMVALSKRCDATVTLDSSDSNPAFWFKTMWDSLGFDTSGLDPDTIISRFNLAAYGRDGEGGLFYIPNLDPRVEMPRNELWTQMNLYMNYLYG